MNLYKLNISYDGSQYFGWQKQPGKIKTIQGEIEKALIKIAKTDHVYTVASGRTDAKVHAKSQIVLVHFPLDLNCRALGTALNSLTPDSIIINNCLDASEGFHPIRDARAKEYRYYFTFNELQSPWLNNYIAKFKMKPNLKLMKVISQIYIGEHNFKNFYTVGTPIHTTIRTILECEVKTISTIDSFPFKVDQDIFEFRVVGTGFLKQMVRLLVGSMLQITKQEACTDQLRSALQGELESKQKLGPVAPPNGLYLYDVFYDICHEGIKTQITDKT